MLRSTRIFFDGKEFRRDRRFLRPGVCVSLGDADFAARNWSLGGLLIDDVPAVTPGSQVAFKLRVDGREDRFDVTAEALRRDLQAGTLACRFVEPSMALVGALDSAIAARFLGSRRDGRRALLGAEILALLVLGMSQAVAAGASVPAVGGSLVPGGAALPEFRLDFPDRLSGMPSPAVSYGGLDISLTSPDRSVLEFLFSPRSQFGITTDPDTGTSRSYAGLSWNVFDNRGFFGNLGLAGSMTHVGPEEMYGRLLGPPLALHSSFEFGYQLGSQHSLTLSLDHSSAPDVLSDHGELNELQLRYGLKF
jgi:hypothetical protein